MICRKGSFKSLTASKTLRNLSRGVRTIAAIAPPHRTVTFRVKYQRSHRTVERRDAAALAGDWKKVGSDISHGVRVVEREGKKLIVESKNG